MCRRNGEGRARPPAVALIALVALAALAACSGGPLPTASDRAPSDRQVLNYQLVTGAHDIAGLDPDVNFDDGAENRQSAHAGSLLPISLVFSGLVTLDQNLAVENWDARKINVTPDGLTYTFLLRDGLKFSDGTPVTADDYAYSINRTLDPCLASGVAPYLYAIKDGITFNYESCTPGSGGTNTYGQGYGQTTPALSSLLKDSVIAPDAKTLVITLGAPAAYFLTQLAYPSSYAIEPSVVGTAPDSSKWTDALSKGPTGQGGSGPYYVSSWDHKGSLVLKANPYFWHQPAIQTINFAIYPDAASAYKDYQDGKSDIGYPPVAQLARARAQSDVHQQGTLWTDYLGMNWKQPPFNDVHARQAFALALDKDQLDAQALGGAALPTNHIVPDGMPGYAPRLLGPDGVATTRGDPTKAKALWQQYVAAACGGQAASCAAVTLTYSSDSKTAGTVATAMQAAWKSVLGVAVALQPEDEGHLDGQLAAQSAQFWMTGWRGEYPDPHDWLSQQFYCCPPALYNAGEVNIADASALMLRADANLDQAERLLQYQQAEQLLVDQVAWVPYAQIPDSWQVRPWIRGYGETALGAPALDQWLGVYVANH